ncbi:MAG: TerD family protein [Acidimicrobiia bacterium]
MSVSLSKGQTVSLAKGDGSSLRRIHMGLGWDAAKGRFGRAKAIDLDASCMVFDGSGTLVDQVWFKQLTSKDGSIHHTGDNRTGRGEGDDESITVDLERVPANATTLVFVVNSFTGQDFSKIENASCRLVDLDTDEEIAKFDLTGSGTHTAQVMAKVSRKTGSWAMTAIGEPCSGRTFQDLLPATTPHL